MCYDHNAGYMSNIRRGNRGGQKLRRPIKVIEGNRPNYDTKRVSYVNRNNLISVVDSSGVSLQNALFASVNARSVRNKIDQIKHAIYEENIDILALTETWLDNDSIYETEEILPNCFTIICENRSSRGGGVAVLCRDSFKPKQIKLPVFSTFECCLVELYSSPHVLRILVIYRPPQKSLLEFYDEFSTLLEQTCLGGSPVIITGDFNIHYDKDNAHRYIDTISAFNLTQHVDRPTHVKGHIIDHIITRNSDSIMLQDIVVGDLLSDHYMLMTRLSVPKPVPLTKTVTFRKLKDIDMDSFRQDIVSSNLCRNYKDMNIDVLVETYYTEMHDILERHAPLISTTKREKREPWFNDETHAKRRTARKFERRYRKSGSEDDKLQFRKHCDDYQHSLSKAKTDNLCRTVSENERDQKALYRTMNKIMHRNQANPLPEHSSSVQLANDFSDYFRSKVDRIQEQFDDDLDSAFEFDRHVSSDDSYLSKFTPLTETDAQKLISDSNTTSCELDPIPTFLLKECLHELLPIITQIINLSITSGKMPDSFKSAVIRPLIKKPTLAKELKNYRPVSNLPYLSKIIEHAVGNQLIAHIAEHNLCETLQSAYKRFHSTETALIKVTDELFRALDQNNAVFLALLDLSAAFDTVNHSILLRRLEETMKVSGVALSWFVSYLDGRTAKVCVDGHYSKEEKLTRSVPQGSWLGPRLYSDYTQPLGNVIRLLLLLFHMYADDTQIKKLFNPKSKDDQKDAVNQLANGVNHISTWMKHNKLKLNEEKTEFLIISSKSNASKIDINCLELSDETVPVSSSARNLGVVIDSSLTLEDHVAQIRKSCFYYLNWIRKVRKFLTHDAAKSLVQSLVISKVDYCNSLLINAPAKLVNKLQSVLHAAARIIAQVPRYEHITPTLIDLHWLPVQQRIQFKVLLVTFKALHDEAPQYISDLIETHKPQRTLRSGDKYLLCVPRSRTRYGDRAFSKAAPLLWNLLPTNIRNAQTVGKFKKLLKTYLFREAYDIS